MLERRISGSVIGHDEKEEDRGSIYPSSKEQNPFLALNNRISTICTEYMEMNSASLLSVHHTLESEIGGSVSTLMVQYLWELCELMCHPSKIHLIRVLFGVYKFGQFVCHS
jgi:hypothetical protein